MTTIRKMLIVASVSLLPGGVYAQQGGAGGAAGDQTDPVTGYTCADRFCISVRPNKDCLCQKQNATETDLAKLRFTCIGDVQACPAELLRN